MANKLYDDFTGGTLDASKWLSYINGGSITQQNGRVEIISNGPPWDKNGIVSTKSFVRGVNSYVSAKFQLTGVNMSIGFQSSSSLTFSTDINVVTDGGNLYKIQNGANVGTIMSVSTGVWYTVKYEYSGASDINVYVDNNLVWTVTSTSPNNNRLTFQVYDGSAEYLDDVYYDNPSISYFNQLTVGDGTSVTSFCDSSSLITAIQSDSADPYFDSTSKVGKVYVYYTQEAGRQQTKVIHNIDGTNLIGTALWSPGALDGTWQKTKIVAYDHDGAKHTIGRSVIGSGEDCSHSANVMGLG